MERTRLTRPFPTSRCDFYVYVIFSMQGIPIYVGKGCGSRAEWSSRRGDSTNPRLVRTIKKYGPLLYIKIRENLVEYVAFEVEIAIISAIGRDDLGRGPLFNLSHGGDSPPRYVRVGPHKEETKKKISLARSGQPGHPQSSDSIIKIRIGNTGKKRSAETCRRNSESHAGQNVGTRWWHTLEGIHYRAVNPRQPSDQPGRLHLRDRPRSERTRKRIATALVGKKHPAERVAKMKLGQLAARELFVAAQQEGA